MLLQVKHTLPEVTPEALVVGAVQQTLLSGMQP
jgi:hypothetical protein